MFARWLWPRLAVVGALTLMAGWVVHEMIPGPALVRWIALGTTSLATSLAAAWYTWLTPEDRNELMPKVRPLFLLLSPLRANISYVAKKVGED
jgi:hypothetical protein